MAQPRTAPWNRSAPKKKPTNHLSEADKAAARARAKRAGRRYPNLVDNMWAATRKKRKASPPAAKAKRSPRAKATSPRRRN